VTPVSHCQTRTGLMVREELDEALALANERAKAELRAAASKAAEAARLRDEEYRHLFAPARELAGELARRAQASNVPMNRLVRFAVFRKRLKSGWVWLERSYWLVSLPGSSSTTISRNLLIDAEADLYWEDGCGQPPRSVAHALPQSREYLPSFTVELVAKWLVAAALDGAD
jgi:hypothetical protein